MTKSGDVLSSDLMSVRYLAESTAEGRQDGVRERMRATSGATDAPRSLTDGG